MLNPKRLILPAVLLVLGVAVLSGCFYVPTFNKTVVGEDVAKKVGEADSRQPVRVGQSTETDVVSQLGPPKYVNADGRQIAYEWQIRRGLMVFPLCFQTLPDDDYRYLVLRFDGAGRLLSAFRPTPDASPAAHDSGFHERTPAESWPAPDTSGPASRPASVNNP